jgi:hypothetical protein
MAPIISKLLKTVLFASAISLANPAVGAEENTFDSSEIPDPQALQAYKRFWDAFQDYERQKKKAAVEEYQRAREGLESLYAGKEKALVEKRVELLAGAIARYQENLEKTPTAANRPYVLLNLAQMYGELSSLQDSIADGNAKQSRQAALSILKNLEESHKTFAYGTDALHLRATLLEVNGEQKAAAEIWKKLAATGNDRFTLYGNIAAGDGEFENASPELAIKFYEKAKQILGELDESDKGLDELRIYYRMAWAHFKAGNNKSAISAARHIIAPGTLSKSVRQKERISRDVAELIGYSLYELDDDRLTREILNAKDIESFGATTSLVIMEQYITASLPQKSLQIAEMAAAKFPLAREYPDILRTKARSEDLLGKKAARLETLEKLSMLLPQKSLWRHRHNANSDVVRYMEDLARNASESVAISYYEEGLTSGNARKFNMAATHFKILLDDQVNTDKAPGLRLKIANCQFFAGNLGDAAKRYAELINELKTPDDILTTAHYQQVLTLERAWKSSFESTVQKNADPIKNESTLNALKKLEKAVDEHANRFPGQSRSVDLLLVAASANRDHNRFDDASRFWQRALLSNPSTGQRSIAVRGLVFSKLRTGKPANVIESVSNFLRLEDGKTLGLNLQVELLGVLASAANEEAERLSKTGATMEAGKLLVNIVDNFKSVPNREQMWRDGAYFFAISGNWADAQASAEGYLNDKNIKFAGDMTYLLARAHEYQLRFNDAVKYYLVLAEKFPSHARASAAIDRAEKLATAEENYTSAAAATKLRADRAGRNQEKLAAYDTTVNYLVLAGQNADAMTVAEERKSTSKSVREKLEAEISIAKVRYESGDKQTAVDDLDSIDKQLDRSKFVLGESFKKLSADVGTILGEHAMLNFRDERISDAKGDVSEQVDKKSKLFADIVTRLDKVASMDQPDFSAKARFNIAKTAGDFADELNSIPARAGEPITLKSQTRFSQNISRLREMAQRYFGNNILAKQRSPQAYAKNEWVNRSILALSRSSSSNETVKTQSLSADQLSTASSIEMPQQWSH